MAKTIRVLIADDHTIVRSGVRLLLQTEDDIEVVGEAENGKEAVELAVKHQPDIVLMDIAMPEVDGLEATSQIKAQCPKTSVLVLTMHRSDDYFFEMLKMGASGYVLKAAETDELIHAVRVIARGDVYLYPTMAKKLLHDYLDKVGCREPSEESLSRREKEIFQLLVEGFSNSEIAKKLVISPSTVHTHRINMLKKLNLSNRHELIQYAKQRGILR